MYIHFVNLPMIDWLNIELPLAHAPIAQGHRVMFDHNGEVMTDFVVGRGVTNDEFPEGSYSSKVMVSSIDSAFTLARVGDACEVGKVVSGVSFRGNPTKFIQGHNVFGVDCIRSLAYRMVERVLPQLGFDDVTVCRALQRIMDWDFAVTKIDITQMFDLGSNDDVCAYLRMLPFTASARGSGLGRDRTINDRNTWYLGKNSTLWSLKLYNKFVELMSNSKAHKLPDHLRGLGIEEFAEGKLRVELVLQKLILSRLSLTNPKLLQEKLNELFEEYTGKMTMKNQQIKETDILKLSSPLQGTLLHWQRGSDLRGMYSRTKYYAHRKALMEYGIDIAKPPIPQEEREAVITPLRILAPKMVTEVPQNLQRYMLRLVA